MGGAFRHVSPLLLVTLVNRMASIALTLLPALLVAREAGGWWAAAAMGIGRGAAVLGSLGSGFAADRFGLRATLVGSMAVGALGVAAMAVPGPLALLVAGAAVAQIGAGTFPTVARLVLVTLVPPAHQREALAWQRTTANLGLVVSFGLGAALGSHVPVLLALDAAASVLAAGLATRLPIGEPRSPGAPTGTAGASMQVFAHATAIVAAWGLAYEAYLAATAATLRATLGPEGVSLYSAVMVVNVIGCSALGVVTARWIDDPRWSLPVGAGLLLLGASVGLASPTTGPVVVGMVVVTVGELVFTATSQFVWMSLVPPSPRAGAVFSTASAALVVARAVGAALAFPLVVDSGHPVLGVGALTAPVVALACTAFPVWRAFRAVSPPRPAPAPVPSPPTTGTSPPGSGDPGSGRSG